jgi:flagellin
VAFEVAGANGILSDAFKEFVAGDTGTGSFAKGGTDNADFAINTTTGKITFGTGKLDFENPDDSGTNNVYDFTVAYTHSNGKVFTETVALTVTNNSVADVGSATTTLEVPTIGRSDITVSAANTGAWDIDFSRSADRDLLSQGAKDFITRHAGDAIAANEVFFRFSAVTQGGTNGAVSGAVASGSSTSLHASAQTVDFAANSGTGAATVTLVLSTTANEAAAAPAEKFTETITVNVVQNGTLGNNNLTQGPGRTEQTGAITTMEGTSDGEAVVLDMKDRTLFSDLNRYTDANAGGSYAISAVQTNGGGSTDITKTGDSQFTLKAGADAAVYTATVTYTDLDGKTFAQDVKYTTTAATNPSTATVSQTSTNQTKDGVAQSTEIVGGKSHIRVDETLRATIKSTGAGAVLSSQLGTFAGQYAKGNWALSGADAASFEVDKNGDIKSKVIMNYEEKAKFNFNLTYTQGDNVYTETIVLDVKNSTLDDGNHIANLNIATQAGALDAISILDTALNSITAAQAKLGSTQNRLQHNIDNLTALSSQTETAKGRITDADYAAETSQLSKQQILSQAATSMLAQANQSKQGVLALLQ